MSALEEEVDRILREPRSIMPSDPDEVLELSSWARSAGCVLLKAIDARAAGWRNVPHPDAVANARQFLLTRWHRAGTAPRCAYDAFVKEEWTK